MTPTSTAPNLPPSSRQDSSEKKRGPGRPPGSTKQNIEQQRLLQQQQQALQSNDIVKVSKDGGPVNKKAKTDFESSPPALATKPVSEVKAKYNIDVTTNNPLKWNVTQVCDFVKNLPGCSDYVEDFQLQEIDGQALMLLKADHLMSAMAIKLGPALKICNAIEAMREELKQNWRRAHRKRVLFKLGTKLVGEIDVIEEQNNNIEKDSPGSSSSSSSESLTSQRASVYDEIFSNEDED